MADLTVTLQKFENLVGGSTTGTPIELINGVVSSIPIIVKNAAGTTGITGLSSGNFTIKSASNPTAEISAFTITENPDGHYVINFTAGYRPAATYYLLINISKSVTSGDPPVTVTDSGSLFLDPSSEFDSTGTTVINYPVNFGNQKFVLGQVNQSNLLNTMSAAFNFVKAANALNCAITLKGANPLQSIVIPSNGTLVPVEVTVKDTDGAAISGPQSVTISTVAAPLTMSPVPAPLNKAEKEEE